MEIVGFLVLDFFGHALWAAVAFATRAIAETVAFAIRLFRSTAAALRRFRELHV